MTGPDDVRNELAAATSSLDQLTKVFADVDIDEWFADSERRAKLVE